MIPADAARDPSSIFYDWRFTERPRPEPGDWNPYAPAVVASPGRVEALVAELKATFLGAEGAS